MKYQHLHQKLKILYVLSKNQPKSRFGLYLNKTLTDNDREFFLLSKWCPSKEFQFPVDPKDARNLRFHSQWLEQYAWLTYSVQEKGALCSYCVLFSNNQVGHSSHEHVGFSVSKVFNRWKNAKQKFNSHQIKNYHKLCK